MHRCIDVCMHTCICNMHIYICMYAYDMYICAYMCICKYVNMHTCKCGNVYVYIYVYVYMCTCIHV